MFKFQHTFQSFENKHFLGLDNYVEIRLISGMCYEKKILSINKTDCRKGADEIILNAMQIFRVFGGTVPINKECRRLLGVGHTLFMCVNFCIHMQLCSIITEVITFFKRWQ